jgi:hypothetical protein
VRPTVYLGTRRGKRWTEVDRGLAEGLIVYESSLNPLGIPAWEARDESRGWTVDEDVDFAMAAVERAQWQAQKNQGKGEPPFGLRYVVMDAEQVKAQKAARRASRERRDDSRPGD